MTRDDFIQIAAKCGAFVEIDEPERLAFYERFGQAVAEAAVNEDRIVQNKGWLKIIKIAEEVEREAAVEFLMDLHDRAKGKHNYYHCAANDLQDFLTDRANT